MRNTWQSLVKKKMKAIGETQEGLAEKLLPKAVLLIGYLAGENLI